MLSTFFRNVWRLLNALLFLLSPLMFIGFITALIALVSSYGEHHQFVQRMNEFGLVTQGVVDSTSPENDWVFVHYPDETGETRHGVLDMFYYDDIGLWQTLTPDTNVTLLYLPWHVPGSDRVILAEHYDEVREYRGYFSPDVIGPLLVCWALVALKPQFLYFGLADMDMLFKDGLPS